MLRIHYLFIYNVQTHVTFTYKCIEFTIYSYIVQTGSTQIANTVTIFSPFSSLSLPEYTVVCTFKFIRIPYLNCNKLILCVSSKCSSISEFLHNCLITHSYNKLLLAKHLLPSSSKC